MNRMKHYGLYIASLAIYAILPSYLLVYAFGYCQIAFFSILAREVGWIERLPAFVHLPYKTLFDLLLAFQEPMKHISNYVIPRHRLLYALMVAIVIFPPECLILTQLLAIYLMSLLIYQVSVMMLKHPQILQEEIKDFTPGSDHIHYLSPLHHMQMKLVTMISLSMVTFIPMSYYQAIELFSMVSISYPICGAAFSKGMDALFKYFAKDGLDRKPTEAFIGIASFFVLLINYKYEQYILNFLCILYCSLILGQTAGHFYHALPKGKLNACDSLIDIFYHPYLIMAFWTLTLFYELTSLMYVPRLLFIASAAFAGANEPKKETGISPSEKVPTLQL